MDLSISLSKVDCSWNSRKNIKIYIYITQFFLNMHFAFISDITTDYIKMFKLQTKYWNIRQSMIGCSHCL